MPLLKLDKVSLHYGTDVLLDQVDLVIHKQQKIGLLGRNGAGKSTLLKLIKGEIKPDSGERWLRPNIKVATLDQVLPQADTQTVYDVVASGLAEVGALLTAYHHLIMQGEDADYDELEEVQHQLESKDGWLMTQKVDKVMTQLQLPAETAMSELSGGWRRRVALAKALVSEPDILLLDEPTNHLDIPAIEWLENQLLTYNGTLIFITHDRQFLQHVADHIMELERGHISTWHGDYQGFLTFREQELANEERANALFDKKLAQEEQWIRQGIKARRTRNEGRVRALKAMRDERKARRERVGKAEFVIERGEKTGKRVAELDDVSYGYDDKPIIQHFSTVIARGDRIGLIGPNGAGKSTLLKLILGELSPTTGEIKQGTNLEVAYFDQLRHQLDMEKNLIDNVCEGQTFIELNGKRRHAISYLSDFLFPPDRTRTPVKALSGGEQNRAILAKLFSKPANVLVLDEPTNDLDIETLELLEDLLINFDGTLLLVSHDRAFMDNVVTSVIVFEDDGTQQEYVGGYSDWISQGGALPSLLEPNKDEKQGTVTASNKMTDTQQGTGQETKKKKLSYKDQRDLESLPKTIEQLEIQIAELEKTMSNPDFYAQDSSKVEETVGALETAQQALEQAFDRWEALEDKR